MATYVEETERVMRKPCDQIVHPFCNSCLKAWWTVFSDAFTQALPVYGPLFLIPAITRGGNLVHTIKKALPNVFWSSAFMGNLGGTMVPIACLLRRINGKFTPFTVFLGGFVNGFISIFIEDRRRRKELAVYSSNQALEALYRMGMIRNILPKIPYADVLLFMFSSSILSYFYNNDRSDQNSIYKLVSILIGGNKNPFASYLLSSITNPRLFVTLHFLSDIAYRFARGFIIGFFIKGSISIVSNCILKKMHNKPKLLIERSFGSSTFNFALFLGTFASTWKALPIALQIIRNKEDGWNAIIGGGLAGLAIAFYRSIDITMFFVAKAIEAVLNYMLRRNLIPRIKNAEIGLFTLAVGIVFYCSVLEPYNLRPSYWLFLHKMSKARYNQFEPIARAYKPEFFEKTGFVYTK